MKKIYYNKKGALFHWIVFGVLAALGLFFILSSNFDSGIQLQGMWQLTFVRAAQESDRNLLVVDNAATQSLNKIVKNVALDVSSQDLGCGKLDTVSLWNDKDRFCELKVSDTLLNQFNGVMQKEVGLTYEGVFLSEGFLRGKTDKRQIISSSLSVIPTVQQSASLFTQYDTLTLKPFYLRYEYNPSFMVKADDAFGEYNNLFKESHKLVEECQNVKDLHLCLDKMKKNKFHYVSCDRERYEESERKVLFCVSSSKEYDFALDFTPLLPFPAEDVALSFVGSDVMVSFTSVQPAESYKIYYTNWPQAGANVPGTAQDIFSLMPSGFSYFQGLAIISSINADCPDDKKIGESYLCNGKIVYVLHDFRLEQGKDYFFAVSSMKDGKESLITAFVKN